MQPSPGIMAVQQALRSAYVQAFLHVVRKGEAGDAPDDYTIINGGNHFTSFAQHPYAGLSTLQGGKAAGAYQFIPSTWAEEQRDLSLPDFSPASQDLAAVDRIFKRGAMPALAAGSFEQTVALCRDEWTSLPGASENNPNWNMAKAKAYFTACVASASVTQPVAPIEEHSPVNLPPQEGPTMATTPAPADAASPLNNLLQVGATIAGAFNPVVGAVIAALSPLVQQKIAAEVGRHTDDPAIAAQVASSLSDVITQVTTTATQKTDQLDAAAAARKDPTVIAQVEKAVTVKLDELAPILDKLSAYDKDKWAAEQAGRDAAAARSHVDKYDTAPLLSWSSVLLVTVVLVGLIGALAVQIYYDAGHKPDVTLIALIGPLLGVVFKSYTELFAYRFDGTKNSTAQQTLIGELSQNQK